MDYSKRLEFILVKSTRDNVSFWNAGLEQGFRQTDLEPGDFARAKFNSLTGVLEFWSRQAFQGIQHKVIII